MSNFAKKVLSVVSGLAVVLTAILPAGVSAAMTSLEAATALGNAGVIVAQSDAADYRLGDTITREELSKVIAKLGNLTVSEGDSVYQDADFADWSEKYAKALNEAGYAASNAYFNPKDATSKVEALKWVMEARDIESGSNDDWRAARVEGAVSAGIATSFSDYDTDVTRGQVFIWSAEALALETADEDEDDFLSGLFDSLDDEETTDDSSSDDSSDTPVVSGNGNLSVSVSPETPVSATIPGAVNGIPVAAFDVTAGAEDVTVTQLTLKRRGLSDKDTITSLAVFADGTRASNEKNDNQENDTEAQLNLTDGGVVVQAGNTVTLTIVADLGAAGDAANDEFYLELLSIVATGEVDAFSNVVSNTMRIGSVDAPTITFTPGSSVSDPKLGETGADIFEFEVEGANDEDVLLKSITFEGSSDAEDDLINFELFFGNELVATTTSMTDDYLTFDLGDGILIQEDKNEDFTVKADVIEGATDDIQFSIDEALDVTAESTKFGFGAAVDITAVDAAGDLGTITIEAGELTIVEIEADFDEIREDKDNVVLGTIKVTNVAGQNLELKEFGVQIEATHSGTTPQIGGNNVTAVTSYFEEVELYSRENTTSYELTTSDTDLDAVFSEDNIDVVLPQGTTTWDIRVDTVDNITNFQNVTFEIGFTTGALSTNGVASTTGAFLVEETDDDEVVSDITPSSITFNTIDGSESGVQVSLVPLSDIDVVRGANEVVALQFEVEAEESSDVVVDQVTAVVSAATTAFSSSNKPNQSIASAMLYVGSVSEANRIDQESGSNIADDGTISFDDFNDIAIAANATETFIITLSVVDAASAVSNGDLSVDLTDIDVEDDENDDIVVLGTNGSSVLNAANAFSSARDITVNGNGQVTTLVLDTANADNEFDKLALAGDSVIIASYDVRADNEEVDVEEVVFTIAGATNLKDSVINATLLLDGVAVETNTNGDITNTTITFENMTDLILPETTSELALQLNTANIGEDFVGQVQTNLTVTDVVLSEAKGAESGKDLATSDIVDFSAVNSASSKTLDIVSAVVTPSVISTLGTDDQTAELRLVVDGGNNTTSNGDAVQAELTTLTFDVSSATTDGTISVFNSNGTQIGATSLASSATAQVDTLTLTGTSGTAAITTSGVTGSPLTATFNTDLTTTASDFVTANSAAYATAGITLTSSGADLIFTAAVAGTPFVSPSVANATGDLAGSVANTTANVAARNGTVTVLVTSDSIGNDNETYRVENTAEAVVRLARDGVTYTINGANATSTKLENTLELGQYADSN